MQIDLSLIPTTFDALHAGLAALVVVLLLLQIILLSVAVISLLSRGKTVPAPVPAIAPTAAEPDVSAPKAALKAVSPEPPVTTRAAPPEPVIVKEPTPDAALQLLGLLQKEARFIDFIQENVANYGDAEIGAAARVVHEGCRRVLREHLELEPVRKEQENTRVTLPKGFDAASVRLTGNIVGEAPFTGTLIHRGWRATRIRLPKVAEGHDVKIIAPAEVEL